MSFSFSTPEQAKLPDAQKTAAKDALGQKALDFALAFQPEPSAGESAPPPAPDFLAEAKKRGLTPATTDFFSADTTPANVPPSPAFNSAAFSLAKDNPISKVIELENGVAVLHLAEIQPSQLRPLDEVKADIQKQLQQTKSVEMARNRGPVRRQGAPGCRGEGNRFQNRGGGLEVEGRYPAPVCPLCAALSEGSAE